MRRAVVLAQPAHDLEAVDPGQHQVEHDEIRAMCGSGVDRRVAVSRDVRLIAGPLEIARHDLGDRRLVVDDENGAPYVAVHGVIVAAATRRERDFSDEFTSCSSPCPTLRSG